MGGAASVGAHHLKRRVAPRARDAEFDLAEFGHQPALVSAWLSRADRDGSLAAFLNPSPTAPERTTAQVED